jgi:radical SAM superfamily enzyme YgiQ (UPF0313 family)
MRPIDEVVSEVAASKKRLFWNIDDNVWGVNVARSIELYREMAQQVRGKWWFGSGDLVSIGHSRADEMLDLARRAGMTAAMVGYESDNPMVLEELDATRKQGRDRLDAIRRIRAAGIEVMLFIMLGSRADHMRDFERISRLCDELTISAHPVMTTPFPGTRLYEEYQPYLIPGQDWDLYDGNHANFVHDDPEMTPEAREDAIVRLRAELFTIPKILHRMAKVGVKGFPMSHITSWAVQYPQGRAFHQFARERQRMHNAKETGE